MNSCWVFVDKYEDQNGTIVFIRDLNIGRMSVTNDAENVFRDCQTMYGFCRVVYEDSEGEMCEIVPNQQTRMGSILVTFQPWNGVVWDKLSRE